MTMETKYKKKNIAAVSRVVCDGDMAEFFGCLSVSLSVCLSVTWRCLSAVTRH